MAFTITLEGNSVTVEPLTLGQIIDLGVAVALPPTGDAQEDMRRGFKRSLDVVAIATGKPVDEILKMHATREELSAAVGAILENSGFLPKKESTPTGEAAAGAE